MTVLSIFPPMASEAPEILSFCWVLKELKSKEATKCGNSYVTLDKPWNEGSLFFTKTKNGNYSSWLHLTSSPLSPSPPKGEFLTKKESASSPQTSLSRSLWSASPGSTTWWTASRHNARFSPQHSDFHISKASDKSPFHLTSSVSLNGKILSTSPFSLLS